MLKSALESKHHIKKGTLGSMNYAGAPETQKQLLKVFKECQIDHQISTRCNKSASYKIILFCLAVDKLGGKVNVVDAVTGEPGELLLDANGFQITFGPNLVSQSARF